jgi:hypothetical protein
LAWDSPDHLNGSRRASATLRTRHVIRITDASPKSTFDGFALRLARARADVVLTTGAILRAEPTLRYDLGGDELANGLDAYRRERLGKAGPPELWVLTAGRDLDFRHPALCGPFPTTVVVPTGARLAPLPAHIRRRDLPDGGLRALLRAEATAGRLISVEAGPHTHRALYDPPSVIDELMLTLFLGELDVTLRGGEMPGPTELEATLGPPRSDITIEEPAGLSNGSRRASATLRFRFLRYRR